MGASGLSAQIMSDQITFDKVSFNLNFTLFNPVQSCPSVIGSTFTDLAHVSTCDNDATFVTDSSTPQTWPTHQCSWFWLTSLVHQTEPVRLVAVKLVNPARKCLNSHHISQSRVVLLGVILINMLNTCKTGYYERNRLNQSVVQRANLELQTVGRCSSEICKRP